MLSLLALAIFPAATVGLAAAKNESNGPTPLKVRFWTDEIEITGAMPNQKTANGWLIAIHQAHPDKPVCDRLVVDPAHAVSDLPGGGELAGLLLELALSTRDGCLEVTDNELVVSGLTDSLVTQAAFDVRLRRLAQRFGGRELKNRISLVDAEALDPGKLPRRPRPVLNAPPLAIAPVEMSDSPYGPPPPPPRAAPLTELNLHARADAIPEPANVSEAKTESVAKDPKDTEEAKPIPPTYGFEPLDEIRFPENSFLVGSDQLERVQTITASLKDLPAEAGKIILRGHPDHAGKHIYNDWLTLSRLKAVRRSLIEAGIDEKRLRFESHTNPGKRSYLGSVRILIPRLTPPDPPPAAGPMPESDADSDATAGKNATPIPHATPVPIASIPSAESGEIP